MNQILGLVDALEALILDAKHVPLTDRVILEEKQLLSLVDKIRLALKSNGSVIQQSVDQSKGQFNEPESEPIPSQIPSINPDDILQKAEKEADKIRSGANEYSDYILANLQMLVTKMQKDMMKFDRNIENGRELLQKVTQSEGDPQ